MAHWEFPEFSHQDMDLLMAYQRVKKFQITKQKDLKAGMVVNVRATTALNNCLVEIFQLNGTAAIDSHSVGYRFHSARTIGRDNRPAKFDNLRLWKPGAFGRTYFTKKEARGCNGGVFVGTLIRGNISFRYNSKVMDFVRLLEKADRFQQHCIIKNRPYTTREYRDWVNQIEYDRYEYQEIDKIMRYGAAALRGDLDYKE